MARSKKQLEISKIRDFQIMPSYALRYTVNTDLGLGELKCYNQE